MNRKLSDFLAICSICIISWVLVQQTFVYYNEQVEGIEVSNRENRQKDALYLKIERSASQFELIAQDAKIDPVWKKTPGYNGLKVNIEASYSNMKKSGQFDSKKLVYIQTSPKIHLKDLAPSPIYRAHPEKNVVSFIVNVAWGNEFISDILSILKKYNVKVSFFLEGRWTKNNPSVVKIIAEAGHEIGNHSYSHPNMDGLSSIKARKEIADTNQIIETLTDKKVTLFGPPSGSFNAETVNIAHEMKMETILWSVDTIDWRNPTPNALTERVLQNLHPGAFVLMHPTKATVQSLETLIIEIKKLYQIVPVSEALKEERIPRVKE